MTNSDFETDQRDQTNPLDPDPAVSGVGAANADTVGVPVGSAEPAGESDLVDGAEVSDTPDAGSMEAPVMPMGGADDSDLED